MSLFKTHKEKRVHPRIPFWAKVKVCLKRSVSDEAIPPDTLGAENLSESGILVETPSPYPVKAPCRIFIRESSYAKEFALDGLVVRSKESRRGKFFDTGIFFPSLSSDQKNFLNRLINRYSS
jgi:hypothetical protein